MVWSEKRYCQKIWRTSIDALNDLHSRHGHDEVSKCTVCVSQTAESTIAKHFQPYQDRIAELEAAQEGKVLVPVEPTDAMIEAAKGLITRLHKEQIVHEVYTTMIAAAQTVEGEKS